MRRLLIPVLAISLQGFLRAQDAPATTPQEPPAPPPPALALIRVITPLRVF
jgi:hypothetical protein